MAGIAKNGTSKVVSTSSESVSELSFAADTTSLQELIESELAMRDPSNNINKSNVVCTDNISSVNNISVSNNRNLAHDSSPSSKFDQIFRETFKEDSDVEDAYTNTPEILSPQLTSSTELLDMSYSMKFEKLTQPETYNQQIIDPLAHQINREDVETDSLDHCQEIIRLKSSIKNPDLNGDLVHTNGSNDYEEINYDPQVKIKNAYNEKFHNEDADLVEYEEISKFHVNQTNMFIENEIYHNGLEKFGEDVSVKLVNGKQEDVVDKTSPVLNGNAETHDLISYENLKVENGISSVERTEDVDPFESLSEWPSDPLIVTSATNYNVKLPIPTEHIPDNKDDAEAIYENVEGKVEPQSEEPEGVDFAEFDPTVTNTSVSSKPSFVSPFPAARTEKTVEEPSPKPSDPTSPQIIGTKNKFVEPTEQLVFESWSTPEEEGERRIQIIEKSESSQDQEDNSTNSQEVLTESYESSEKKTAKKKKNGGLEETTVTTTKTKKSKKSKKSDEKENHISVVTTTSRMEEDDLSNVCVRDLKQTFAKDLPRKRNVNSEEPVPASVPIKELKSSFSKFDELSKKALASSMTDVPRSLQNGGGSTADVSSLGATSPPPALCKSCGKNVFVMEQIKAEKQTWHKNCFRCHECNKQLTLDIYSSHEGVLYCKPHFRELFKPKAVVESQEPEPSSDKPDLGLEELSSLNVKSRYQVFEKSTEEKSAGGVAPPVKRSPSILSKVAKFQAKGALSAGVSDENLNGHDYQESESSAESEDEQDGDVSTEKIIKNRKKRERPLSFSKMSDVKKTWENGPMSKEERLEERKLEKQNLRSRLFMGKQGRMKEMYEQAVADSEKGIKREIDIHTTEKAKNVREKFERGDVQGEEEGEGRNRSAIEEDLGVFEAGISKKSRSLFLELDANAAAAKSIASPPPPHSTSPRSPRFDEARRASKEGESPEPEVYRDPNVVRAEDAVEDDSSLIVKSATASKMLSIFRQMEEAASKEVIPDGPKPLKSFTPPPDYKGHTGDTASEEEEESSEEEEEEEEEESETEQNGAGDMARASYKVEDEFLKQAQSAARAKSLAAKFEHWEPEKQSGNNAITMLDSEQASLDSTKSLRARFESMNSAVDQVDKPKPKVNRFVMQPESATNGNANQSSLCFACNKKVYPLEKIETDGRLFHRACFRCTQCCTVLRMESYTMNNGHLYCLPHFKQLFISRGNYDEGFGNDQHKRKWQPVATAN